MSVVDWLIQTDKETFRFIQMHLTASWLDGATIAFRTPISWIPLYLFIFIWVLKFEKKISIRFICSSALCIAITDCSTAHILKPFFERLRHCYDENTKNILRGIVGCGGKYSFPSSHAANHFGLAAFWFWAVYFLKQKKWRWLWLWAFLVSFAQVYVGVHFPLDVTAGALLGIITGTGLAGVFKSWSRFFINKPDNSSLGRLNI